MSSSSAEYVVVVNDEEQFSVWPAGRLVPDGWRALPVKGTREYCLDHIASTWTDIRPLSMRRALGERS